MEILKNDNLALSWGKRSLAWDHLDDYIHSTSRRIKEFGVKKGDRVLVDAVLSHETVIIILSLWHAGVTVCPLDPNLLATVLEKIIPELGTPAIMIGPRKTAGRRCFSFNDTICVEPVEHFFSASVHPSSLLPKEGMAVILSPGTDGALTPEVLLYKEHPLQPQTARAYRQETLSPLHQARGLDIIFQAYCDRSLMIIPGEPHV